MSYNPVLQTQDYMTKGETRNVDKRLGGLMATTEEEGYSQSHTLNAILCDPRVL